MHGFQVLAATALPLVLLPDIRELYIEYCKELYNAEKTCPHTSEVNIQFYLSLRHF